MTEQHIKALIKQLTLLFTQFNSMYQGRLKDISDAYWRVLENKKVTPTMFKQGLLRLEQQKFFPNPAQFAELCRVDPNDLGLPDPDRAYKEACELSADPRPQRFSHDIVYLAGKATGWFELRHTEAKYLKKTFLRNYEIYTGLIIAGENISQEIPKALEPRKPTTKERTDQQYNSGKSVLEKLKAITK